MRCKGWFAGDMDCKGGRGISRPDVQGLRRRCSYALERSRLQETAQASCFDLTASAGCPPCACRHASKRARSSQVALPSPSLGADAGVRAACGRACRRVLTTSSGCVHRAAAAAAPAEQAA